MWSDVSVVLRNGAIIPLGYDMCGELGNHCGSNWLEDVLYANNVRLDLLHIWLNWRVRECVSDERECVWFQDVIPRCGNGVTD
jgi:hypothetical protein